MNTNKLCYWGGVIIGIMFCSLVFKCTTRLQNYSRLQKPTQSDSLHFTANRNYRLYSQDSYCDSFFLELHKLTTFVGSQVGVRRNSILEDSTHLIDLTTIPFLKALTTHYKGYRFFIQPTLCNNKRDTIPSICNRSYTSFERFELNANPFERSRVRVLGYLFFEYTKMSYHYTYRYDPNIHTPDVYLSRLDSVAYLDTFKNSQLFLHKVKHISKQHTRYYSEEFGCKGNTDSYMIITNKKVEGNHWQMTAEWITPYKH